MNQLRNREAEARYVREHLWGEIPEQSEDDMEINVMGDFVGNLPYKKKGGLLKKVALIAGIALGVPTLVGSGTLLGIAVPYVWDWLTSEKTVTETETIEKDWKLGDIIVR